MSRFDRNGVSSGVLIAELVPRAPAEGRTPGAWSGLTITARHRQSGPQELSRISLCSVAQGRNTMTAKRRNRFYEPFKYPAPGSHLSSQAVILAASPSKPFLSFVCRTTPASYAACCA